MSISDNWLLVRAQTKQKRRAQPPRLSRAAQLAGRPIGDLWAQLQKETVRQAAVYTTALGDPGEVVIETPPNEIHVRMRDGRHLAVRLDPERGELSQSYSSQPGVQRHGKPVIRFMINSAGELVLNYGLQASAGSLLRRLIG